MAGGQHHHRTNIDKYHPGYFGKVGMRHFHLLRNHYWCPTVNLDKVRHLYPIDSFALKSLGCVPRLRVYPPSRCVALQLTVAEWIFMWTNSYGVSFPPRLERNTSMENAPILLPSWISFNSVTPRSWGKDVSRKFRWSSERGM